VLFIHLPSFSLLNILRKNIHHEFSLVTLKQENQFKNDGMKREIFLQRFHGVDKKKAHNMALYQYGPISCWSKR
jgi:hypothetical protein